MIIKIIKKILYTIIVVFICLMFIFAVIQKSSDNRKSICGIKIFTVVTGSMIPVYNIGDILIVKDVLPEDIKVDDDIVYKGERGSYKNKTITHRVVSVKQKKDGNYSIVTKGVANTAQDPEINQTQVYGRVVGKIPIINYILRIITNAYVWVVGIPSIIIIKMNIKKLKNLYEEMEQE